MRAAASEFIETVIWTPMTFRGVCSEGERVHHHRSAVIIALDVGRATKLAPTEEASRAQ